MPVFHPTMPSMALKTLYRGEFLSKPAALTTQPVVAPSPFPIVSQDDTVITPAAPPSAVQMQIKALMSEQALTLEAAKEAAAES
ncbi:hypothetical protein [Marivita sp.]|uniref:hypothetical protein n=1 Tax=Marivita sp. TaxID=2003365 RepID=UPI003A89185E